MVVRVSDLQSTPVDGDLVILNLAMSSYIGLDNIGHRIWQMLETPIKIDELIRRLTTEYAGGPQEIARDLIDFLNELYSQNLIAVVQAANTHKAGIG
jgi:hypothetical protein